MVLLFSHNSLLIPSDYCRLVNGLLKTALGVPAGSVTSLSAAQDTTLRNESVKCLTGVIKSMSIWMDQQLRIGDFAPQSLDNQPSADILAALIGEEAGVLEYDLTSDANHELYDTAMLEQRRAYKLEFQVKCFLFLYKDACHF